MKKVYLMLACVFSLGITQSFAQCPDGRYKNQIFSSVDMSTVTYSTPYSLSMDIYQPSGDTLSKRPVIILAHGGSFYLGDKASDVTVNRLCTLFAKRGYVTASIDYRLSDPFSMVSADSTLPIDEVIKAVSDGKAAVRYFMKDAATTNTYKVDTNNIFAGGNSAGAVLYMHVGYLSGIAECPDYIVTAMNANGGFDGNSGNDGYNLRLKGIVDLAGGLNTTSFISSDDMPSVNVQGDADQVVPYTCGYPDFTLASVHVKLCGLGSMEPVLTAKSIYHMSHVFPGSGHVPWDGDTVKFKTVDSLVTEFLYSMVCTNVASVNETNLNTEVSLFPNPASDVLNINAYQDMNEVTMFDETGRTVLHSAIMNSRAYEINTSRFTKGLYLVKIGSSNNNNTPVVKRIVVE